MISVTSPRPRTVFSPPFHPNNEPTRQLSDSSSLPSPYPETALEEAVPLLTSAEMTYASIQMFAAECDVLYLLSVVLHNMGNQERRDAMARKHEVAMEMRELYHLEVVEPWVEGVWTIVADVGAAIASR